MRHGQGQGDGGEGELHFCFVEKTRTDGIQERIFPIAILL